MSKVHTLLTTNRSALWNLSGQKEIYLAINRGIPAADVLVESLLDDLWKALGAGSVEQTLVLETGAQTKAAQISSKLKRNAMCVQIPRATPRPI